MRLDVIVFAMCLISILVGKVSARRTLVPSDRTTLASGAIMKAKGSLRVRSEHMLGLHIHALLRESSSPYALDNEKGDICVWRDAPLNPGFVILRQTRWKGVSVS